MDATECCICMETLQAKNIAVTSCGHKFCLECLLKHYSTKNNCPLCREELLKDQSQHSVPDEPREMEISEDELEFYEMYNQMLEAQSIRIVRQEEQRLRRLNEIEQQQREQDEREREQEQDASPLRYIMGMVAPVRRNIRRCGLCRQEGHDRRTCLIRYGLQRNVAIR